MSAAVPTPEVKDPTRPEPPTPALVVDRVSAAYGPYRALFEVSFTVPAANVVALLGSNGAGKSTVARVVTGLLPTTEGRVLVDGQDVTGRPAHAIARLGVAHVPEGRGLFGRLSVEENLFLSFRQRVGKAEALPAVDRAFEAFPILGERRRQRAGTLSGGQQRLLSLAKILVAPPRILVADELSLGLAPIVVDSVYEGLQEIHRSGTAIVVVEQQVDRALELAGSAVVLEHGSVAFAGRSRDAHAAVDRILGAKSERMATASAGAHPPPRGWSTPPEREWRWSRRAGQSRGDSRGRRKGQS